RQGVSWAIGLVASGLARKREVAAFALLEPGVLPLGGNFAQDRRVKRRVGRLAAGAGPISHLRHCRRHPVAVHCPVASAEYPGGGVDSAELLRVGRRLWLGLGLWSLGVRGVVGGVGPGLVLGDGFFRHVMAAKTALRNAASRTSRCIESVTYL